MSVRERFFKKVQQKQNFTAPSDGSVAGDIQAFCQRMDELAQQVQQWFEGSGIDVAIATIPLQDLSTIGHSLNSGASRYDITTIRLQNGTRSVSIMPGQLYQKESKGCVTLTVNTPDRTPVKQYFYLCMAPVDGWLIRNEQQLKTSYNMMTEDVFFSVIDKLV
ncbi:hypothetical protein [Lelliottia wanjuensis]|uniref:Uncharacterized protein n=1 Tax=Lelliottia wanjuensis TaxID=3050585 RepID=A0AAP4FY57_9ENTR|nr:MULTISPECIES: hypothetical protein [unclassified Lelliottia]MDK9365752.1 hypothetical protein [Lelliottia sp. V106_12]MDK9618307.1 hypothetical protein [Lelliottia sp. V106_9]